MATPLAERHVRRLCASEAISAPSPWNMRVWNGLAPDSIPNSDVTGP